VHAGWAVELVEYRERDERQVLQAHVKAEKREKRWAKLCAESVYHL